MKIWIKVLVGVIIGGFLGAYLPEARAAGFFQSAAELIINIGCYVFVSPDFLFSCSGNI